MSEQPERPGGTPDDAPLAGIRVLEYAQYVAGPLATMLLADLGADVIKVEPPSGDAWRHYAPIAPDESLAFYALNRNKRSVVLDLKSPEGREMSDRLVSTADAVVHNLPVARAASFGLDRESVRRRNPKAVWSWVSAFGGDGPDAGKLGYDLIAQAVSGLLMADVRETDDVPRRSGGIPMADIAAGILCCAGVLAGLFARAAGEAPGIEVSLLGAALLTQAQKVSSLHGALDPVVAPAAVTPAGLAAAASEIGRGEELEPYYRCYETSDGYVALACLNVRQRRQLLAVLGLTDPWVGNPQSDPVDEVERATRKGYVALFAAVFRGRSSSEWLSILSDRQIPVAEVRDLAQALERDQVRANGLVQSVHQPGIGPVRVLGNLFKLGGRAAPARRPAPLLGEHDGEVLGPLTSAPMRERPPRLRSSPAPAPAPARAEDVHPPC
jgi:crotonobetainyl-CoA:carnitine CoA-transferase CaiB-like acyl-CoA transferase